MKCVSCGSQMQAGQRFCEVCGTRSEKKCKACGALKSPSARFCGSCGQAILPEAPLTGDDAKISGGFAAGTPDGERRQLTVLFADVVGATALSGRLDPEDLRELLRVYQKVCVESADRYGGNVHQYAGDGVLAYFGYPVAHDNDAERAVLAALDIVQGTKRLATALRSMA